MEGVLPCCTCSICYAFTLSLCHTLISLLTPQPLCVLPDRLSPPIGLILDLAVILILSSYLPIMCHVTHFPYLYRPSHVCFSLSLMTPLHCYDHASLISYATCPFSSATSTLPYYAPMCSFLEH